MQLRVLTIALENYRRKIARGYTGTRRNEYAALVPKAYEGIVLDETPTHLWLGVDLPAVGGTTVYREIALERRNIIRRELVRR